MSKIKIGKIAENENLTITGLPQTVETAFVI